MKDLIKGVKRSTYVNEITEQTIIFLVQVGNFNVWAYLKIVPGYLENVEAMKSWLRNVGSPSSKITKAEFTAERELENYTFQNFDIRR